MNELKVEYVPIESIKPYEGNAKKHPRKQIEQIKESIKDLGMNDPIGIKGDIIVEGHGRYTALKELGWKEVPIIRLDHMNDEQMRTYVHVHNQLTMNSGFDLKKLKMEVEKITKFDLSKYGIDIKAQKFDFEKMHGEYKADTLFRVANIQNLEKAQYPGVGPYDIPIIKPVYELPPIREWIRFKDVLSDSAPEGKAVHFFIDDYQFERLWKNPEYYIDKLKRYACVASPDFSPYGDMPMALQIYNHYRKHWVAAYMQHHGVTVIPTIRASSDPRSKRWFLDGEPEGGIVIVSSMWEGKEEIADGSKMSLRLMNAKLKPKKVFVYGKPAPGFEYGSNVEHIKTFNQKIREDTNAR